ncbi:uncharacterized protein LOC116290172 [Actinia tenebrosa]|uniref:Uncharacterized protein LOC116290172 n=1 Tax=Actinia tenebrosa TaxID=6105 RepID=A0A6P8H9A9_ACTTE|nr:uncharacterized protein LOC116290172 [Actinia tenebrosa]
MKTVLLVLVFAGFVVYNKGSREQDDTEDVRLNKDLNPESSGEKRTTPYSYDAAKPLMTQLESSVQRFYGDAARRAKKMYLKLTKDWENQPLRERTERTVALKAVAENIDFISDAYQGTTPAILAVLNLLDTLKQLTSSDGHIVSLLAMFISSFMNLLGETRSPFSIKNIVTTEIKKVTMKYREDDIQMSNIKESGETYLHFKTILNRAGKDNDKISVHDANSTHTSIRNIFVHGFPVIDKLRNKMIHLIDGNKPSDAKKFMAYFELYTKLETVRQMLLIHTLSLVPEQSSAIAFILSTLDFLKTKMSLPFFNVIRNHTIGSKFMAYYDGQVYKVSNAYMAIQLDSPMPYDDSYPGLRCIAMIAPHPVPWKWFKLPGMKHPYFARGGLSDCKWRIVYHGQDLFSIMNKFDCPNGDWCDSLLSFDGGDPPIVTVEPNDPVLWELKYNIQLQAYAIKPKRFCDNTCERCSVAWTNLEVQETTKNYVGRLDCSAQQLKVPQYWQIYKAPSSFDMASESGSASTNQSQENQEDNSGSGEITEYPVLSSEENNGGTNFSDDNDNEILIGSKQENNEQSDQDPTASYCEVDSLYENQVSRTHKNQITELECVCDEVLAHTRPDVYCLVYYM